MPTTELYGQRTQEQQLPGIEPPTGRLKTAALANGPPMCLAIHPAMSLGGASHRGVPVLQTAKAGPEGLGCICRCMNDMNSKRVRPPYGASLSS